MDYVWLTGVDSGLLPGKILCAQKNWNPVMFDDKIQAKVSLIWSCCRCKEITYDLWLKTNAVLKFLSHKWWTDAIIH